MTGMHSACSHDAHLSLPVMHFCNGLTIGRGCYTTGCGCSTSCCGCCTTVCGYFTAGCGCCRPHIPQHNWSEHDSGKLSSNAYCISIAMTLCLISEATWLHTGQTHVWIMPASSNRQGHLASPRRAQGNDMACFCWIALLTSLQCRCNCTICYLSHCSI